MSTVRKGGAIADLGTSEVARVVGTDPNVWAFTAMQEAPEHVQHTVMAVMNTASRLNTVQRQLLGDAACAVDELNSTLNGRDMRWGGHRWTTGLLGMRSTRIEQAAIQRGGLLRELDTLLNIFQQLVAEPSPPATRPKALGVTPPAQTPPKPSAPRR
ncbi:hypothetical protein [Streptomyces antarcticus]|uniref:hypothetical protein n=1 Tax=Streptomyces antarcticus TaxID=2996458 RepID=UPI002271AFD1|nr:MULTISPECIES: hypothetical protein [unclassified Streptomyces]MCY0942376.1 hypothetical protein [Streptomyces sp. H34-AA3]MCZ4080627.1 hypothetical protein [Streptomyces sp. H34-S5]